MAEEGLRVVRQWLEASSQLEEGEKGSGEAFGCGAWQGQAADGPSCLSLTSLDLQPMGGRGRLVSVCPPILPGRTRAGLPLERG